MTSSKQIVGLLRPLSKIRYGYTYAQNHTHIWKDLLDAKIVTGHKWDGEKIYFYVRSDYGGEDAYNYFGGLTKKLYNTLKTFVDHDAEYFCLDFPMLDIGKDIKRRIKNPSTYSGFTEEFADKVSEKCKKVVTVYPEEFATERLTIGDSHSLSMTFKNSPVKKLIGKTLYSVVHNNLIDEFLSSTKAKTVSLMFGSIDIRHHLFRQEDPYKSMEVLVNKYIDQCIEYSKKYNKVIEICSPVPCEWEGRKLPKSGYYKDTPFYGSREERLKMTLMFISIIDERTKNIDCVNVVKYPDIWYSMDGKIYADTIMERPSNTHVALKYARLNNFGCTLMYS